MKLAKVAFAIIMLGSAVTYLDARCARNSQQESVAASQRSEDTVIKYLQLALAPAGKAFRIYFRGSCSAQGGARVLFPLIDAQPPAKGQRGLEGARDIFRKDSDVTVTEGPPGIVRIKIGNVSTAILSTRLPFVKLTQTAQYNPEGPGGAIDMIEGTRPIETAMARLGLRQVPVFYIGAREPALSTLPHLPPSIKDVTLDQALDSIAKTFRGVVTYGECTRPNGTDLIDIEFQWLRKGQ